MLVEIADAEVVEGAGNGVCDFEVRDVAVPLGILDGWKSFRRVTYVVKV